ncbi:DUF4920 domain-containing protein [Cesiribacter sp. SM1]|uniref:DUF4920 domain-containing protein n=1 Tax=Cesiribacter sp. SM1 TaxID=2861196 RepID=UPI001CD50DBB|nr:DUF4920 domain-containing protein [Cesiribacter sp. SM1]
MKNTVLSLGLLLLVAACQTPATTEASTEETAAEANALQNTPVANSYGREISAEEAKPASQVPVLLQQQDSLYLTLSGTALSSCTKKGCWMTVDLETGESMRVTFKDYGFFVPKDLKGEQVVMEGVLKREVSSVEEQRHYAEDAGKSAAEIAAIQQPDTAYTFEAVGVRIWPLR